jgi:glycine/D-amino acid oxidase-like deaminating enzyme
MRFAILGAGFAGLAVTWFILHYTKGAAAVDLFDPEPIGGGASGLSSGLLHPYVGKQARVSWEASKCIKETHRLITVASQALAKPIILSKGILRPALSDEQMADFQANAQNYSDTEWWNAKQCEQAIQGLKIAPSRGGLFIKDGLTLDVESYLQGLWQACVLHGTQYYQQGLIKPADLEEYDRVLLAMGPFIKNFQPLKDLPITAVKGQMLELKWPDGLPPLTFSLVGPKYIVMRPGSKSCFAGATYEHTFSSPKPEQDLAAKEIMPQIATFFPDLKEAPILSVRAAFRASAPNHLPLVGKLSEKFYFLTGLGSRGLLYHAWIGKHVARTLLTGDTIHLPEKIHHHLKI